MLSSATVIHSLCSVVDCPSCDYLDSLIKSEQLSKYHHDQLSDDRPAVAIIVHFTPSDVMKHDDYQQWMNKLVDAFF